MALRKIVVQGDECLTKVCRPVTEFNAHLHELLDDMTETLEDANGAGLAAPQVGVLRRVCVVLDEGSVVETGETATMLAAPQDERTARLVRAARTLTLRVSREGADRETDRGAAPSDDATADEHEGEA